MIDRTDVAVIGGGPGGAATATFLAQAGVDVALFEKQLFPRFQVGESLVPAVNVTLERLGVLDRMDAHRFPRKHGVQFFSPERATRPFYFSEVRDQRMHHTWQVLRSEFDALLLENARQCGVRVFTETEVTDVVRSGSEVSGLRIATGGDEFVVNARIVVDGTGQNGLLARRLSERVHIPGLRNTSVYAHFADVVLDEGIDAGSTLIYRLQGNAWLWFIPLPDRVSIGLVAPAGTIASFGRSPTEILESAIDTCPFLKERLGQAVRTTEVRAVRDYSYRARKDGGVGWALVGDALGFIDPIYSTGLFLTMFSAELAAEAIFATLAGKARHPDFAGFSVEYQTAFDRFL